MLLWNAPKLKLPELQMEFFAEDEVITVIPNVNFKTTDSSLICIGVCSLLCLVHEAQWHFKMQLM